MWQSKLYNTPAFFQTPLPSGNPEYPQVPGGKTLRDAFEAWFNTAPFALPGEETGKLTPLMETEKWSTNVGHPGPAYPAIGEIFSTFVIPNMFARAAHGRQSPEDSVREATAACHRIFAKWRQQELIGGKG